MTIKPDDLEIGMMVTVLKRKPRETSVMGFDGTDTVTRTREDHSWYGDVLKVTAINLPFVVVDGDRSYMTGVTLDMREIELAKISAEYVTAKRKNQIN